MIAPSDAGNQLGLMRHGEAKPLGGRLPRSNCITVAVSNVFSWAVIFNVNLLRNSRVLCVRVCAYICIIYIYTHVQLPHATRARALLVYFVTVVFFV